MGKLTKAARNLATKGSTTAAKELGKAGGKSKSPAKVLASRRNGRKHVAG